MKKIFLLLSFIFGIMNFSYSQIPSCNQGVNCNPDSYVTPQSDYSLIKGNSGVELVSFMNNGVMCYCEVYYRIKVCIDPNTNMENKEIYIEKIVFDPNCIPTNKDIAISAAVKMMVKFAPLYFGNPNFAIWSWRVTIAMPKCWNLNGYTYEGCYNPECCKTEYFVNYDRGTKTYNITDKNKIAVIPNDCSTFSGASCTFNCNANDLPYGPLDNSEIQFACSETETCNNQWSDAWVAWNDMYLTPQYEVFETHLISDKVGGMINGYISYKKCVFNNGDCEHWIKIDKVNLDYYATFATNQEILIQVIRTALHRANGLFHERLDNLKDRTQGLPACVPESLFIAKILIPQCWKRISTWNGDWLVPCSEYECCYHPFGVKYDIPNGFTDYYPKYKKAYDYEPSLECESVNCGSCINLNSVLNSYLITEGNLPKINILDIQDDNNNLMIISPNPAKNQINIEVNKSIQEFELELNNINGENLIQSHYINQGLFNLKIDNLSSGIYLLSIKNKEINISKKLIINK